jgi:ABC-2 type transport system ATP-binding protein
MTAARPPAVEIRSVTKDFAVGMRGVRLRAVGEVSLRIEEGEVFGLLGPNGSGKSTTIKILLGLVAPTLGEAAIFGIPCRQFEARRRIGYLPESPDYYRHLSGLELVRFAGKLCGLRGAALSGRVAEVIEWVGMRGAADRRVGTYSKGMLQRIGLAQALVHEPGLVILDEPTAGVDPLGAARINELIGELKSRGTTVLITSHLLAQVEEVCDRVAIMDHGRVILEGQVADLTSEVGRQNLSFSALPEAELNELIAWFSARGHSMPEFSVPRISLEQVFRQRVHAPASACVGTIEDRGESLP